MRWEKKEKEKPELKNQLKERYRQNQKERSGRKEGKKEGGEVAVRGGKVVEQESWLEVCLLACSAGVGANSFRTLWSDPATAEGGYGASWQTPTKYNGEITPFMVVLYIGEPDRSSDFFFSRLWFKYLSRD